VEELNSGGIFSFMKIEVPLWCRKFFVTTKNYSRVTLLVFGTINVFQKILDTIPPLLVSYLQLEPQQRNL